MGERDTEAKKDDTGEFDRIFSLVGGHGKFQFLLLALTSIQSGFLVFHHIGYLFLGAVPAHTCLVGELQGVTKWSPDQIKNLSIPWSRGSDEVKWESCQYNDLDYGHLVNSFESFEDAYASVNLDTSHKKYCDAWEYDRSTYSSTVVTEYDLVCDKRYLVATIQASYMVGVLAGCIVLGSLSDEVLGRRKAVLISVVLILIGGFGAAIKINYWLFIFFRFITAMGVAGSFQNNFCLLLEHSDPEYRALFGILVSLPFAVGYMVLPVYGYFIRDWVPLQLAFSLTTLLLLIYFWLTPESPRWLATIGRLEESFERFARIAEVNGKPKLNKEEVLAILKKSARNEKEIKVEDEVGISLASRIIHVIWSNLKTTGINYWNLVKGKEMRRRSFTIWTLFSIVSLVYYGVVFDSPSLTSDPYMMVFLMGVMEVPAYSVIVPFVSRLGRRPVVVWTFLATGVTSLLMSYISFEYEIWRILLSMFGKFAISSAFAVIYLLAAELFPTSARTTGLGSAVLMGRIGSILAPYVVDGMRTVYRDMPSIIFGVFSLLAGFITLFCLPETKDEDLNDQMDEIESEKMRAKQRRFSIDLNEIKRISRRGSKVTPDHIIELNGH